MKLSKSNSLIYRFVKQWGGKEFGKWDDNTQVPPDICPFMRKFVLLLIAVSVLATVAIFLAGSVIFGAFIIALQIDVSLLGGIAYLSGFVGTLAWIIAIMLGALLAIATVCVAALCLIWATYDRVSVSTKAKEFSKKFDNSLVVNYIKAKHNKFCTQIEFID